MKNKKFKFLRIFLCSLFVITSIISFINNKQVIYADFFDMDFNHVDLCIDHENAPVTPSKPENFELMISCARKLSQGTKHLRVDFYEVDGHLYTGELTFFHCGGFRKFITEKWDLILGDWISIK